MNGKHVSDEDANMGKSAHPVNVGDSSGTQVGEKNVQHNYFFELGRRTAYRWVNRNRHLRAHRDPGGYVFPNQGTFPGVLGSALRRPDGDSRTRDSTGPGDGPSLGGRAGLGGSAGLGDNPGPDIAPRLGNSPGPGGTAGLGDGRGSGNSLDFLQRRHRRAVHRSQPDQPCMAGGKQRRALPHTQLSYLVLPAK